MRNITSRQPLVSVLMPVYNAASYVEQAVESVLSQSYSNWELLILDDGSRDGSYEIVKKYEGVDERVRVLRNRGNRGIGYTRKRLANLAKGKYAAIMDADDVMVSTRIAKQVAYLEDNPGTVVVGGQCVTIDASGKESGYKHFPLEHEQIYSMMFTRMSIQQPASMINLSLVPTDFPWYDNSVSPVEDLDNLFRLFQSGKFANLVDDVLYYRVYPESSSLRNAKRTFFLTMKVRMRAVLRYGYRPAVVAWMAVLAQAMMVAILPSEWVFPVYAWLRGMKRLGLNKVIRPALAYVKRG